MRQVRRGLSECEARPASRTRGPKTSSAACSTLCVPATAPRRRANGRASCMLSGECIKACDYGVNPRFLLAMARLGIAKADNELAERRRQGVERYPRSQPRRDACFRACSSIRGAGAAGPEIGVGLDARRGAGFRVLHRLQCAQDAAHRLACPRYHGCARRQLPGDGRAEPLLRHRAARAGDVEMSGRMGSSTMEKLSHSKSGQVISWCPSCYVQYTETTLPTIERQRGSRPFEMTPFMRFLGGRLAQLKPHLQRTGRNAGRAAQASRRGRRRGSRR